MLSLINSVSKLLILLVVLQPVCALAAADFCVDPAQSVCSQKEITSDLGVSQVGPGFLRRRISDRVLLRQRALDALGTRELQSFSGEPLSKMATALGIESARCSAQEAEACRALIAERLAETSSRVVMLFSDEQSALSPSPTLQEIETSGALAAYKTYLDFVRKDAATFRRPSEVESQLRSMFPELVDTFITKVKSWPVPEPQKSGMIGRLKTLSLAVDAPERCSKEVPAPYEPGAGYSAKLNRVTLCSGILNTSTSPASLAVVLAHEISHTVGPCFIDRFSPPKMPVTQAKLESVYGGLLQCLHDRDGSTAASGICTPGSKVNESFADWAGSELAAEYLPKKFPSTLESQWRSRFSGTWSFECGQKGDAAHPDNVLRFNEILFSNTKVQKLVGCPVRAERECRMGSPLRRKTK